jgi:hypothetical protein
MCKCVSVLYTDHFQNTTKTTVKTPWRRHLQDVYKHVARDFVRMFCVYIPMLVKVFFIFWTHNKFRYPMCLGRGSEDNSFGTLMCCSPMWPNTHTAHAEWYTAWSTEIAYFQLDTNSGVGVRERTMHGSWRHESSGSFTWADGAKLIV